ncbi:hypothetical protein NECAME_15341, partial [Necator americanus]
MIRLIEVDQQEMCQSVAVGGDFLGLGSKRIRFSSVKSLMQSDIVKKLIDVAPIVIPIIIAYFEVIGLFGNINLIAATARHKHLRTKH